MLENLTTETENENEKNFEVPFLLDYSIKRSLSFFFSQDQELTHPSILFESKNDTKNLKSIAKIQCAWKMFKVLRTFKILKKKFIYRKFVIDELIKSEFDYKSNLDLIIKEVIHHCFDHNILNQTEIEIIFSNIVAITALSSEINIDLKAFSNNFDNKTTEIGKVFHKYLKNFEIYFDYCRNYKEMQVVMGKFIKKNHPFSQFLEIIERTETLNNSDLFSFLIKPIQRLPKYVLLFKDLLKNTEKTHPDYENIMFSLKKFEELNKKNNENMEDYLIKQTKIIELQQIFGTPNNLLILNGGREFIQEEVINLMIYSMPNPVICYFLSDAIIVAKRSNDQCVLTNFFELDSYSFIKDVTDQTYFKDVFNIYGKKGGITFSTETKEAKKNLMNLLENEIIANLKLKQEINIVALKKTQRVKTFDILLDKFFNEIRVSVLGTTQRGIKNLYNVYVIEIRIGEFIQKSFLRYSECLKLDDIIKKDFAEMSFPHLSKDYWFNSNKIKTIEARKIIIENFLQSILTNQILMKNDRKILKMIGFPESFDLFQREKDFNCDFIDPFSKADKFIANLELFSTSAILRESIKTEKKRIANKTEPNYAPGSANFVQIKLSNEKIVELPYTYNTKIYEIFQILVEKIGLKSFLDYKLFLEEKPLDDDEFVYKILENEFDEKENEAKSFFSFFKTKGSQDPYLIFKKYYFLTAEIEERDLRKDRVKLELLSHQIFQEASQFNYKLSVDDYSLLAALQIYLKNPNVVEMDKTCFAKTLKKFIPNTIFPKQKEHQWENSIKNLLKKIQTEIGIILDKSLKEKMSQSSLSVDFDLIIFLTTINFIKQNNMYGSRFFWVNASVKNEEKQIKIPELVCLSIKHDSLNLISPENKEKLITMRLEKLDKINASPMCLNVVFEGRKYKFNSSSSFEMYELINDYIKIKRVMPRARKESDEFNKKNFFD